MKKRFGLALAGVLAVALIASSVAVAEGVLSLSASPTSVKWPHISKLTLTKPSDVTSATIMQLPAGASEWTTKTADTTLTVVPVKPSVTTAYKAVAGGLESDPVTVTVAAALTRPQINKGAVAKRPVRVKGQVRPGHKTDASVTVEFYRAELVPVAGAKGKGPKSYKVTWVLHSTREVALSKPKGSERMNPSTWSLKWTPDANGRWKIVVTHEDLGHAKSSAAAYVQFKAKKH